MVKIQTVHHFQHFNGLPNNCFLEEYEDKKSINSFRQETLSMPGRNFIGLALAGMGIDVYVLPYQERWRLSGKWSQSKSPQSLQETGTSSQTTQGSGKKALPIPLKKDSRLLPTCTQSGWMNVQKRNKALLIEGFFYNRFHYHIKHYVSYPNPSHGFSEFLFSLHAFQESQVA